MKTLISKLIAVGTLCLAVIASAEQPVDTGFLPNATKFRRLGVGRRSVARRVLFRCRWRV